MFLQIYDLLGAFKKGQWAKPKAQEDFYRASPKGRRKSLMGFGGSRRQRALGEKHCPVKIFLASAKGRLSFLKGS